VRGSLSCSVQIKSPLFKGTLYQVKDNTMSGKKTIRFISPVRWDSYDFSPDEIYANRPPTWNGEDDEPEDYQTGEDYGEDE
jgi:hypothetical protein